MKILITGAQGQLGAEIVTMLSNHKKMTEKNIDKRIEVFAYGRDKLDITNPQQVEKVINEIRPNIVVHTAAYTKVDQAESEEELAYTVNAYGTRNVVVACEKVGAKLCYISTDYVFDGTGLAPYKEYDHTNPIGVYGKSKYAGEQLVQTLLNKYFIVRTSWVYGKYGNNFVKTMLKLAEEKSELSVVYDQVGCPTYTYDLASFIIELVQTEKYGIYHASNSGSCSWHEFAKAIFEEANIDIKVEPVTTDEFPRPAPRPTYSVMDDLAIRANKFKPLRHWRAGLNDYIKHCVKG